MNRVWRCVSILALLISTTMCTSGGGGGCTAWSEWQNVGTTCDSRFLCFGKSQRGTYYLEERSRQCNNGIQKITRRNFSHCGC
jgi:hypothetical protein